MTSIQASLVRMAIGVFSVLKYFCRSTPRADKKVKRGNTNQTEATQIIGS
jgi:hypothetical protein